MPRALHTSLLCMLGVLWLGALVRVCQVPVWGTADRGDYWRAAQPAGLRALDPRDDESVQRYFRRTPSDLAGHPSSAAFVARVASYVRPFPLPHGRDFDLRQLGVVQLLLLLPFAWWIALSPRGSLPLGLALSFIALDPTYLRYFNSFYAEPCVVIAVVGLSCVWLLGRAPGSGEASSASTRGFWLAVFALASLGSFAKQPYVLVAAACAVPAAVSAWRSPTRPERVRGLGLSALLAALSVLAALHFGVGRGYRFPAENGFNTVFTGIAAVSDDPAGVLRELGLPAQLRPFVGRHAFDPSVPRSALAPAARVSRLAIARLYLGEPATLMRVGRRIGEMLAFDAEWWLGQWERARSIALAGELRGWTFAGLRARLFAGGSFAIWTCFALCTLWWLARARRWTPSGAAMCFLWCSFVALVVTAVLGDGTFSLSRHLIGARIALDLLWVVCLWDAARVGLGWWRAVLTSRRAAGRTRTAPAPPPRSRSGMERSRTARSSATARSADLAG